MNDLVSRLQQGLVLTSAIQVSGGPDVLWLAQRTDHQWILEGLKRLGPIGLLVGSGRLPVIDSAIWESQQGVRAPRPLNGSWVTYLRSGTEGLLVPDDDNPETNWSVFLAADSGWLPAQIFFDTSQRAVSRVAVDAKHCMMDRNTNCIAVSCPGPCRLQSYAGPPPSRQCACQQHLGH
jgi:hypothetical protein